MSSDRERRRRREALAVGLAAALVMLGGLTWWAWTATDEAARAEALLGLPPFPSAPDAGALRRARPGEVATRPAPPPPSQHGRLDAFALAPSGNVAVLQVNALVNTPFARKVLDCMPPGFREGLADAGAGMPVDVLRDVDRIAAIPDGVAISGTFPADIASRLAGRDAVRSDHRGAEVYTSGDSCVATVEGLVVMGGPGGCEGLVDRVLDSPPPAPRAAEELDSDIYLRTDMAALKRSLEDLGPPGVGDRRALVQPLVDAVGSTTLRANVWDHVALSVDARPAPGKDLQGVATLVEAALDAARDRLEDDPDRTWAALVGRGSVDARRDSLHVDLALPADELLQRLDICPRPAMQDAGT